MKPVDLFHALLVAVAAVVAFPLAVEMAAGGQGWYAPIFLSFWLVIAGPIVGGLWLARRQKWAIIPAFLVLAIFSVGDFILAIGTVGGDFAKALHYLPGAMALWFVAWFYPQVLLFVGV